MHHSNEALHAQKQPLDSCNSNQGHTRAPRTLMSSPVAAGALSVEACSALAFFVGPQSWAAGSFAAACALPAEAAFASPSLVFLAPCFSPSFSSCRRCKAGRTQVPAGAQQGIEACFPRTAAKGFNLRGATLPALLRAWPRTQLCPFSRPAAPPRSWATPAPSGSTLMRLPGTPP